MPCPRFLPLVVLATLVLSGVALAGSPSPDTQPAASTASAASGPARPWNAPIHFGRSGSRVAASLPPTSMRIGDAVLRAYGRQWTKPVAAKEGGLGPVVDVDVPDVRVPTVFSIVQEKKPDTVMAELVAYPNRDVQWDRKVLLIAAGAPQWFEQWAKAVGLPVQWSDGKAPAALPALKSDERCLLILGRETAGKNHIEFLKGKRQETVNVLILEAPWLAWRKTPLELAAKDLQGPLAAIQAQRWSRPLAFSDFRAADRAPCNGWAIHDANSAPSLEVVGALQRGPWTTLSGLQWAEQLGRREEADELLSAVLRAAATFAPKVETVRLGTMLYPEKVVYDPKTMAYCPTLACLARGEAGAGSPRVLIVDLRGPGPAPADALDQWRTQTAGMGEDDRLLLLGDDPILIRWDWLRPDRPKKTDLRPEVVWLEDDRPWTPTNEIPLMRKLTELGVPIAPPGAEEKKK